MTPAQRKRQHATWIANYMREYAQRLSHENVVNLVEVMTLRYASSMTERELMAWQRKLEHRDGDAMATLVKMAGVGDA
jgi:hypothetical protein